LIGELIAGGLGYEVAKHWNRAAPAPQRRQVGVEVREPLIGELIAGGLGYEVAKHWNRAAPASELAARGYYYDFDM
jgi:anthranilate phosphoribosyltransferase